MKVNCFNLGLKELKTSMLVALTSTEDLDDILTGLPRGELLKKQASQEKFSAKKGQTLFHADPEGDIPYVLVVGLGKSKDVRIDDYRVRAAEAVRRAASVRVPEIAFTTPSLPGQDVSKAMAEGATLGTYRFDRYQKPKDEEKDRVDLESVLVLGGDPESLERGVLMACGQNFARDLANEPGNVINPGTLADRARAMAEVMGLQFESIPAEKLKEMGMNALLAVGGASENPPCLIHVAYRPEGKPRKKVVLVGKGITFDTGGLNLKPGEHMRTMKGDKTGACVVLGVMRSVSRLRPDVEVHALVGAAENAVSGSAYRPDDIIRAYNGKTIEVDNTDAEGRLTLADVLAYGADTLEPDVMIDIATLTGACAVALGPYTAGVFSNRDELSGEILLAAGRSGERFWRLPMDDDRLRKKLESPVADLVNTGGRYGGAITAAMFLEAFVPEDLSWAHLDIAGVDHTQEVYDYYAKGATAFGVRTLLEFLLTE